LFLVSLFYFILFFRTFDYSIFNVTQTVIVLFHYDVSQSITFSQLFNSASVDVFMLFDCIPQHTHTFLIR
jgi:hypothetical protein